jgi:hypothetical protein
VTKILGNESGPRQPQWHSLEGRALERMRGALEKIELLKDAASGERKINSLDILGIVVNFRIVL